MCVMSVQNQLQCGFSFPWVRKNNGQLMVYRNVSQQPTRSQAPPASAPTSWYVWLQRSRAVSLTRGSRAIQSEQGV